MLTSGIDVGSCAVKFAVLRVYSDTDADVLVLRSDRIRRRDLRKVINEGYSAALEEARVQPQQIAYAASTGEGELVEFRRGHFMV